MKKIVLLLFFFLILYVFLEEDIIIEEEPPVVQEENQEIRQQQEEREEQKSESPSQELEGNTFDLLNRSEEDLVKRLGEPDRKDPTAYGYEWYIYENLEDQYIQIGMEDGRSTTIFATGGSLQLNPIAIGDDYNQVMKEFPFKQTVSYQNDSGEFQFKINDEDIKQNPLVKLDDDLFAQFYFDTFTNSLSSIRIITGETLLRMKPYAIEYWGTLPEEQSFTNEEWNAIQQAREKQIFAITNVIRGRFQLEGLEWDESVSEVAYLHSEDMSNNNYFSHTSLNGDGLKERLGRKDIKYLSAGENIAALYVDAPAAVEGWLNSEGHRKAMLNEQFTHLGTGVHKNYYTQNFLQKF